jgi:hypothetical protein
MAPRRETYRTSDGRNYTLWADINDVLSAIAPAYRSNDRDSRRERGWMFRGQPNAKWEMTPTLYRPPLNDAIINERTAYTNAFIDALQQQATLLTPDKLTEWEYIAIAQHYGFHTPLIDFSWNMEVAAYFATLGGEPGEVGVICAYNAKEYEQLRNPFSALDLTQSDADRILKDSALPDLVFFEHQDVPRIWEQEGTFVHLMSDKIASFNRECIDRYYFRQRAGLVYVGNLAHRRHVLMGPQYFNSEAAYEAYLDAVRKEHPAVFERTPIFDGDDLFPPIDPLSMFANAWKSATPSPHALLGLKSAPAVVRSAPSGFAAQIEAYYYEGDNRSPYQDHFLAPARAVVESLVRFKELDDLEAQRWLLWELLNRFVHEGVVATLRLGDASHWGGEDSQGIHFSITDRWLGSGYDCTIEWARLEKSPCRITFGELGFKGRTKFEITDTEPLVPPTAVRRQNACNLHECRGAEAALQRLKDELAEHEEGVIGAFLYDLHRIVLRQSGRNLELTAAIVREAPCLQRSQLVRQDHSIGPALLLRVHDRFAGGITHTAVCNKHWSLMSAADIDLIRPSSWTILGLA